MPQYFKKHKQDSNEYTILPSSESINDPRPIDFNKGNRGKWIVPGLGESQIVARNYYDDGKLPAMVSDYQTLLKNWGIIRQYRNRAAHTEWLKRSDLDGVVNAFNNISSSAILSQLNDLKMTFKQK